MRNILITYACAVFTTFAFALNSEAGEIAIYKGTMVETSRGYQGNGPLDMATPIKRPSRDTYRFYLVRDLSNTRRTHIIIGLANGGKSYSVDPPATLPLDVVVADEAGKLVEYVQLNDAFTGQSSTTSAGEFRNATLQISGLLKPLELRKTTPPVTLNLVAKSLKGTGAEIFRFATMTDERFGHESFKIRLVLDRKTTEVANDPSDPLNIVPLPGTLLYGQAAVEAALQKKGFTEK